MNSSGEQRIEISDPADFGKVAVMSGGDSSEREISLASGAAVLKALRDRGVEALGWDPAERGTQAFADAGFDRAWLALHGPGGEDGSIQGALQWLNTPYTGSGVMSSALAMDKVRSKHLFRHAGIQTPEYAVVEGMADVERAVAEFGFPIVLKPAGQGSSVGMSKVFDFGDVHAAAELALGFGDQALVERCVVGPELTVAVLQGVALPSIRIETPRAFYDYRAKYESDRTTYVCPGTLDDASEQRYRDLALQAFGELGCSGWGRIDFMQGADGEPQVLEVNTIPGMTGHSLVPMAAKRYGIDFEELCWRILETSIAAEDLVDDLQPVAVNGA